MEGTIAQLHPSLYKDLGAHHRSDNHRWLIGAIICSLFVHAALMVFVPQWRFDTPEKVKQTIEVELVKPTPPPAPPIAEPEPPAPIPPEPIKPPPKKKETKPDPIKQVPTKVPEPISEPVKSEPPPTPQAPPPVIAVNPVADKPPEFVAPPPPPPEPEPVPQGPSESELDAARLAYKNSLQNELKRNQRYPRIAQTRGIQGDVGLEISIDRDGNVTHVRVAESSGNDALDNDAVNTVKRSNLRQFMQDILRGRIDKITVTLSYKLAG